MRTHTDLYKSGPNKITLEHWRSIMPGLAKSFCGLMIKTWLQMNGNQLGFRFIGNVVSIDIGLMVFYWSNAKIYKSSLDPGLWFLAKSKNKLLEQHTAFLCFIKKWVCQFWCAMGSCRPLMWLTLRCALTVWWLWACPQSASGTIEGLWRLNLNENLLGFSWAAMYWKPNGRNFWGSALAIVGPFLKIN